MIVIKRLFLVIVLFITANSVVVAKFDHSIWNGLLQDHVYIIRHGQASRVDYAALLQQRAVLRKYLSQLSAIHVSEFTTWSKPERLAFLINAYNAYTVELILTRYPRLESIKDLGFLLFSPWKKSFVPLLGETHSLDDIEHGMIRKSGDYHEPRIHFAANCASIGCPALRNEAYTGIKLEEQLEAATHAFLADRTRNRYNATTGKLEVSEIFDWYGEDFAQGWRGWHSLNQFFAHYAESLTDTSKARQAVISGDVKIKFLDYDWKLNRKR